MADIDCQLEGRVLGEVEEGMISDGRACSNHLRLILKMREDMPYCEALVKSEESSSLCRIDVYGIEYCTVSIRTVIVPLTIA